MLKRMLRRYSVAEYKERVAELRREVADLTLSTDVIVGFPGETREDFEGTLELVRAIGFSGLFGFKYSPRPYTPALRLDGEPTEEEKSARLEELFLLADGQREAHLETLVGSTARVICEGRGKTTGYSGRSERNEIVHFEAPFDATGQIVPVRITRAFRNSLAAEPLPAFLEASRPERVLIPEPRRTLPVLA
jgi:tRNA-2-methylthio-N6-dimethylallyladenosine synthase